MTEANFKKKNSVWNVLLRVLATQAVQNDIWNFLYMILHTPTVQNATNVCFKDCS